MKRIDVKRIRRFAVLFLTLLLLSGLTIACTAQGVSESAQSAEQSAAQIDDQLEQSGAKELMDQVPEDAKKQLQGAGIEEVDPDAILGMGIGDFFSSLWNMVKSGLLTPVKLLATLMGIILLCALLSAFRTTMEERGVTKVFSVVSSLCICGVMIAPVSDCMIRCGKLIEDCSNFILSFIPVFTTVMTVSGKPASSMLYNTFLFSAVQVVAQIASSVLVPLLAIYLAFCLAGSVSDHIKIDGIAHTVKTTVVWALGFLLTVFVGILSLQSMVANSADTVATKAVKFVLGSSIPVVGGAISEALNSVQGCMGLMKSTVGVFGVLACVFTFLPMVINLLLLTVSLNLAAGLGEMLKVERVPQLLKAAASALSLMLSILICFALLLIVSTTIMMVLGMST